MTREQLSEKGMYRFTGDDWQRRFLGIFLWRLEDDDGSSAPYFKPTGEKYCVECISLSDLEPVTKTLDDIRTLEVNDVLVDGILGRRKILGICGLVLFLSVFDDFDQASGSTYTPKN
jgi:hypothetical protein